jgi:hypothetical protein
VPAVAAFVGSFLGLAYYAGIVMRLFQPAPSPALAKVLPQAAVNGHERTAV